ncbi:MBL fold metallo-hydrolase [Ramlibacter sp. Leaf400]|uniref:MBL fold metallo-hydrolase n=1 Tax=Ramlibacter sp. Leaf400 TaxID=1736365 RepID=UPI0006F57C3B|nr:MBL fold metallo-hydrolase [Ramlibacter sp. Leaf400]KQT14188.1 MBL fold metallo-hydrolase [Ramlibacter sp. Leaf400]
MGSRLARWLVRATVMLAVIVAVVVAAGWVVLSQPQFGAPMAGARLERALANPQYRDGRFVNLEPEAPSSPAALGNYIVKQFSGDEVRVPPAPPPVLAVDKASLAAAPPSSGLRAFWIGHASTYVELDGLRFLLDPVFSERVSPLPVGPGRFHAPPVALADLPRIDAVLISHDHYDHLDMDTVRHLARRGSKFFVPLGIGAHLERWGVPAAQIEELEWWQERTLGSVRIVCTPTRHYSGRGLRDRSSTLWSSWSVVGPDHRFFYSGDTGYSRLFQDIGARLGPFDIAFVKIGAYGPGASWFDIHMPPEQAVQVHRDVRGKRMFPVHWSTFNLAYHDWDEPIRRTLAEAGRTGVELVTPRLGEWVDADREFKSTRWWEAVR